MSLVLSGVLIALALLVFGKNIAPQTQIHPRVSYLLAALAVALTLILSMVKVHPGALAESSNSKLIIVGGRDGLPLILNTETGGAVGK